jgi:hypothetical protein
LLLHYVRLELTSIAKETKTLTKTLITVIIISGSTGLAKRPWLLNTGGFVILLRHSVGLLRASDKPAAKASTYTG